ncbi:hypothetical protein P3L51_12975 [Streptomyces sp. PSRA5]|uniref:hypothetical protein n=1 Tax=Streptomyces panacea TaxID=3035064 RepID=UPI00339CAFF7
MKPVRKTLSAVISRRDQELIENSLRRPSRREKFLARQIRKQPPQIRTGGRTLRLVARLLPGAAQSDWLEEQRAYLTDLPDRRARRRWVVSTLLGMPRYAYTVRTGRRKEAA